MAIRRSLLHIVARLPPSSVTKIGPSPSVASPVGSPAWSSSSASLRAGARSSSRNADPWYWPLLICSGSSSGSCPAVGRAPRACTGRVSCFNSEACGLSIAARRRSSWRFRRRRRPRLGRPRFGIIHRRREAPARPPSVSSVASLPLYRGRLDRGGSPARSLRVRVPDSGILAAWRQDLQAPRTLARRIPPVLPWTSSISTSRSKSSIRFRLPTTRSPAVSTSRSRSATRSACRSTCLKTRSVQRS